MAILSFFQDEAFIFVITMETKQRLEVNLELGFVIKHHPGLNSNLFFFHYSEMSLRLPEIWHTYRAPHFLMHICCTDLFFFTCCQSVQSHIDPMHLHGSSHEAHCLRFAQKFYTSSCNVVHLAALDDTHGHSFLTFSWISLPASRTLRRTAEWRFDGTTTLHRVSLSFSLPFSLLPFLLYSIFFSPSFSSLPLFFSVVDRFRIDFVVPVVLIVMMWGVSPAGWPHLMACLISIWPTRPQLLGAFQDAQDRSPEDIHAPWWQKRQHKHGDMRSVRQATLFHG